MSPSAPSTRSNLSRLLIGSLPADREHWANNAIFIDIREWLDTLAQTPEDGQVNTVFRVRVDDALGASSTAEIPIEVTIGTIAGVFGQCTQVSGNALNRVSFELRQSGKIIGERTVSGDQLDDWIIGLAHETHYISEFKGVELHSEWRASDNPFRLDCSFSLRSDGVDVPLLDHRIDGYLNHSESSWPVAIGEDQFIQKLEIYGRIYGRAINL